MNALTKAPLSSVRHDWTRAEIEALFALPFNDLLFQAATVHRQHFDPNAVQVSTLLSIKRAPALKTANTARNRIVTTRVLSLKS